MRSRLGVLVLLSLSGCVAANLETRDVIASLSYPENSPTLPSSKLEFQLYAALQLDVLSPWRDPAAAAKCLEALPADGLRVLGESTSGARDAQEWAEHVVAALPTTLRPVGACAAVLDGPDGVQLAWSLAQAASTVNSFSALTWLSPQRRDETWPLAVGALKRHARLIAATPPALAAQGDLPVLALSGGAANGAFTAGFLYELLATREEALATLPVEQREAADQQSRFSAVVGTSVGAVQSELLDFLWAEEGPLTPEQQSYLDSCNAIEAHAPKKPAKKRDTGCFSGGPDTAFPVLPAPSSPRRACALKLLVKYFAEANETDLLCAEPGSVLRAVGFLGTPTLNLMRFDRLQQSPMNPMLDAFGAKLASNGLDRVTVSVEAQQSQLLGLDERACAAEDRRWCLSSGVMASAVMPGFARPVTHAWSGFEEKGECGVWFDGGMRSGLPVLRALSLSRGAPVLEAPRGEASLRVLGLDTGRLTSSPSPAPKILVDVAMGALEQLYTQNGTSELSLAQTVAEQRDAELSALRALMVPTAPKFVRSAGPGAKNPRVRGLFVPSDVPDWIVVGAGYAFDPPVMRGLFLWGREVARTQLMTQRLAQELGWPVAEAMQRIEEQRQDADYVAWLDAYRAPTVCPAYEKWRVETGAKRVKEKMSSCADSASGIPPYFVCPADAWNAGGAQ